MAAVVAAPIQKLWPLYDEDESPAQARDLFRWATKKGFVTGVPPAKINGGPEELPRTAKYDFIALTG